MADCSRLLPTLVSGDLGNAVSFCCCMESDGSHVPCTAGLTRRKFVKASPLPPSSPQQEVPELGKVPSCMCIASFPGHSHLQYLIAYSMQIQRGKAWEMWLCAFMSGRQKVDIRGAVPDEEFRSPFLYYRSEGWRQER